MGKFRDKFNRLKDNPINQTLQTMRTQFDEILEQRHNTDVSGNVKKVQEMALDGFIKLVELKDKPKD